MSKAGGCSDSRSNLFFWGKRIKFDTKINFIPLIPHEDHLNKNIFPTFISLQSKARKTMGIIQFTRNTPLYPSAVIIKINGEIHKLKSNKTLELELPEGDYNLLICNEYEKFEGTAHLTLTDRETTNVQVGLKNARAYQLFLVILLLTAFVFVFLVQVPSLAIGLIIFAVLIAYWGIEYYNRKSYFTLKITQQQPSE